MAYHTLISVEDLAGQLGRPDLVILDARFILEDEKWGEWAYAESHIPGAQFANLATHLSGEIIPGKTGRRPLPSPQEFARALSAWGIGPQTQVVAYDAAGGLMAASRVWWMLRWAGHDKVAVLDGGWKAWVAAGKPVTAEVPVIAPQDFPLRHRPEFEIFVDEVDQIRTAADWALFDSRSAEGYHGKGIYHDPVRGHLAGARLANRADTMTPQGFFRPAEELRAHFQALIGDVAPERVVFYCGSGVTAAQNLLAFHHAGLGDARHYVGSWSEWILDPTREIAL